MDIKKNILIFKTSFCECLIVKFRRNSVKMQILVTILWLKI